jgi:hypothetical protein
MFAEAFHRPLRYCSAAWVGGGCLLAAVAALLAFARVGVRDGLTYAGIAVVLASAALAVARGVRSWRR